MIISRRYCHLRLSLQSHQVLIRYNPSLASSNDAVVISEDHGFDFDNLSASSDQDDQGVLSSRLPWTRRLIFMFTIPNKMMMRRETNVRMVSSVGTQTCHASVDKSDEQLVSVTSIVVLFCAYGVDLMSRFVMKAGEVTLFKEGGEDEGFGECIGMMLG